MALVATSIDAGVTKAVDGTNKTLDTARTEDGGSTDDGSMDLIDISMATSKKSSKKSPSKTISPEASTSNRSPYPQLVDKKKKPTVTATNTTNTTKKEDPSLENKTTSKSPPSAGPTKKTRGSFIHIDHSSHHTRSELKFAFTYNDDDDSLGSSVCSGLRNSLHSSNLFDFDDLVEEDSDGDSFGGGSFISDIEDVRHWRLDPEESLSDWTMVVESVPDGTMSQYHIHKSALVNGKKRGDFFVSLFENEMTGELNKPVKVHEDAAMYIPEMLDFIYSGDDELEITSDSATGLRHLSQFFGIRALAKRVVAYMYDDVCLDNMATYLECANAFDDLQTAKLCADRCAQRIDEISSSSPLLEEMDPSFLLDIVSSKKLDRRKHSGHMSKLVAVYCILKRDVVNGGVFEELTSVEYLPVIDEESALPLLMLESKLVEESCDDSKVMTLLQKRCIKAILPLVRGSADVKDADRKARTKALSKIPKKVLVEILSRSIS